MPELIEREYSVVSPERPLMALPRVPIARCWSALLTELNPPTCALAVLPELSLTLALLEAGGFDGRHVRELRTAGYQRQPVSLAVTMKGRRLANAQAVVFHFEDERTSRIPLVGLFDEERMIMRGSLQSVIAPGGIPATPHVRFEPGALEVLLPS